MFLGWAGENRAIILKTFFFLPEIMFCRSHFFCTAAAAKKPLRSYYIVMGKFVEILKSPESCYHRIPATKKK